MKNFSFGEFKKLPAILQIHVLLRVLLKQYTNVKDLMHEFNKILKNDLVLNFQNMHVPHMRNEYMMIRKFSIMDLHTRTNTLECSLSSFYTSTLI